ncbi:murein biosynthesis integral membrane protein MurJ [Exiguobacterium acetylicum]|uniref:murein biosynthesis integral membrane protein MurJ n=1 Tax=Exiguobacterium acetylicum TaxID=41170 RepID=UPI0034D712E5
MSFLLILFTLFTKIMGFIRDLTLSYFYGASGISDAYLISMTIPGTIFTFVATGISTSFIPLYHEIKEKEGFQKSLIFTNQILKLMIIISTILILILFIFTGNIVSLFASGLKGDNYIYAIYFTRISATTLYFSGVIYVLKAYSEANGSYLTPVITSVPAPVITIFSIYLSTIYSVYLISIGSAVAIFIQFILTYYFIFKKKIVLKTKSYNAKYLNRMYFLALPVVLGTSVNQINVLVDRTMASSVIEGGISIITYASRINFLIQDLFVISIVTIFYPIISRLTISKNTKDLALTYNKSINFINILLIPSTILIFCYSEDIIRILYGRGSFDEKAIKLTSSVLWFYSFGIIFNGWKEIFIRGFYSNFNTKIPVYYSLISTILNILLSILLVRKIGILGLPIATSIAAVILTISLFFKFNNTIVKLEKKTILFSIIKITVASSFSIFTIGILYKFFKSNLNDIISFLLLIILYYALYLLILLILNVKEIRELLKYFKKRKGV